MGEGEGMTTVLLVFIGTWLAQDSAASIMFYPTEKWKWNHIARLIRGVMGIALIIKGIMELNV